MQLRKIRNRLFLAFFVSLLFVSVQATEKYAVSENGSIFCRAEQNGSEVAVRIYSTKLSGLVSSYTFPLRPKEKLKAIRLSPNGKYLEIITEDDLIYFVAAKTGIEAINFYTPGILKPALQRIFYSPDNQHLLYYNGIKLFLYTFGSENQAEEIKGAIGNPDLTRFDSKGEHFIVNHNNNSFYYRSDSIKKFKSVSCPDLKVDDQKNILIGYKFTRKDYSVSVFRKDKVSKLFTYSSNTLLHRISDSLQKTNADAYKKVKPKITFLGNAGELSPNGMRAASIIKIDNQLSNYILIDGYLSATYTLEELPEKTPTEIKWKTDSTLLITSGEKYFLGVISGSGLQIKPVKKPEDNKCEYSSDYSLCFEKGKHTVFSDVINGGGNNAVSKYSFVDYSGNSEFIFLKEKDKFYFLRSSETDSDTEPHLLGETKITGTQQFVESDAELPEGTKPMKPATFVNISDTVNLSGLKVDLVSAEMENGEIVLRVSLKDTNGNVYTGAATEKWLKIFCNLSLRKPNNLVRQISNFKITEGKKEKIPVRAITVALDFSGSMGPQRAQILENGIENFINKKRKEDYLGILKYDDKIKMQTEPDSVKKNLHHKLRKTSFSKMGNGTSILDAMDEAILSLSKVKGIKNKSIILFTDGLDNSSTLSKKEIISNALKYNIKINTIGFADWVDEEFLKSISQSTGGSYTRLYGTENMEWIFDDVLARGDNHYEIRFTPDTFDVSYSGVLNICGDKGFADTLLFSIKNIEVLKKELENPDLTDADIKPMVMTKEDKGNNLKPIENVKPMDNFSQVTNGSDTHEKPYGELLGTVNDSTQKEFDEIEFPNIKFVFDLTAVIKGTDEGIDGLVKFLKKHIEMKIEVQGHTDNKGDDAYNMKLSQERADKIKQNLVGSGIAASRINAKGYGEEKPVAPNDSEIGRTINRRIEFVLVK
ncbi:MAG: OmpA family protein [Bacteroidia bacterium]|nr:OmpA family protein [Bacteroidia bacterium]